MPLLQIRAVEPYQSGANATDVIINQVHFNRTALDLYNYTLYNNGTLSNGSNCYLAFQNFQPHMLWENGTVVNGTSCFAPINPVGSHASAGLAFAILFAISIGCSLLNLRKHRRRHLPHDQRWNPHGRCVKWYWLLFVAVCGTVSGFMSIDVDRGYLQGTPLVLQSIFYTLLLPGIMAAVWEAVRNWGSWQERMIYDRDPYAFTKPSNRAAQEFMLPILFYICFVVNIILTVPRSWDPIAHQRSPDLIALEAQPSATDQRWRSAGFVALTGLLITCYSLEHSIYRYRPRATTLSGQIFFYISAAPSQFLLIITLLGIKISYAIASSFDWEISPLNASVNPGWLYSLGYAPVLAIIILFNICGYCDLNEDKAIISMRDEIDAAVATDIVIGQKNPPWWKKTHRFVPTANNTTNHWHSDPYPYPHLYPNQYPYPYDDGKPPETEQDRQDLDRYVELGIIHRQDNNTYADTDTENVNANANESEKTKIGEIPLVTTTARSNSQTSQSSSGFVATPAITVSEEPDRTGHQMRYVLQSGDVERRRESLDRGK